MSLSTDPAEAQAITGILTTPDGTVWEGACDSVQITAHDGMLGVLPGHAPYITLLGSGPVHFISTTGTETFVIHGGFLKVLDDQVVLLAHAAEAPDEIDVERAREAEERALEFLRDAGRGVDAEQARAKLAKARLRLKAAMEAGPDSA